MTRLMKRLRRRGKRLSPTRRIVCNVRSSVGKIMEVVPRSWFTWRARTLLCTCLHLRKSSRWPYGLPLESALGTSVYPGTQVGVDLSQQAEKEVGNGC